MFEEKNICVVAVNSILKFILSNAGSCAISLKVSEFSRNTSGVMGVVNTLEKSNFLASVKE